MAQSDTCDGLVVERRGPALVLALDRPQRKNALTAEMIVAIADAVDAASADDETRVIVLCARGADFCSGIDLVQSTGGEGDTPRKPRAGHLQRSFQQGAHRMIQSLDAAQLPVVSAVRGWAAGLGNALALSADVVVASTTARFWVPFVTKGFTPDSGNTWLLPRLVGLRRAKEMVLRGKPIAGPLAAEWGLVTECVEDDMLESAVDEVVAELAAAATVAYGLARTVLHRNLELPLPAALQNEAIHEELAVRSDDFKEGMRAFAEKRDPDYSGW
jgi:2-(1,2-epoxy-1,2-dihydrophenyl)acetyl-CoA isomerase